uniref:Ataxin 1 like n=1 Tax=Leptobrachium leishanense TaxID=445787 RepID=A0A8C5QPA5_9ANUR
MKPAHERSQECLPPKKRELLQNSVSVEEPPRVETTSTNDIPSTEALAWPRGVVVGAGQGHGVRYEVASEGAETVTVDQYGNLYKLAVPSAAFSPSGLHPVVNMSSIQPSFNVASPLIQHPGIAYPPIHYAPISHTSVQFLGSPYAVPYSVPPGFLQRAVISPPVTLAASHVPHYVPYNSILAEGVTPPPQAPSPHSYSKATAQSQSVLMGVVPVDVGKGRVPVFYQHPSQLPAYPVHEMLVTCPSTQAPSPASENDKGREASFTSTNGAQRVLGGVVSRRDIQVIHNADDQLVRGQVDNLVDCEVYSGHSTPRTEAALLTHRSTPDTDLEVQRVVGGFTSRDFASLFFDQKQDQSPLNLSHNANEQMEVLGSVPVHGHVVSPTPEQQQHRIVYPKQQALKYSDKPSVMVNGETIPSLDPGALQHGSKIQGVKSSEVHNRDSHPDRRSPRTNVPSVQPPNSTTLPSHFMKGAIIQLATGELKRVEDLQTQDFVRSAEVSGGLKIDSSTVVDIQESQWPGFVTLHFAVGEHQSKVCLDVPPEHPFFVYGQGWSSCSPKQTAQLFALPCHRLQVGDVCISISLQNVSKNGASDSGCPPASRPNERSMLHSRDRPSLPESGKQSPLPAEGSVQNSHGRTLSTNQSSWSSPGVQRYSGQSPDSRPSPSRHSFIPQEVKLSIEGRSNAGK